MVGNQAPSKGCRHWIFLLDYQPAALVCCLGILSSKNLPGFPKGLDRLGCSAECCWYRLAYRL
ncbi:MAG: hypothetical protein RRZ24_05455 [Clostridia bacterium]